MRVVIFDEELLFSEALASLFAQLGHDVVPCPATTTELLARAGDEELEACLISMGQASEHELGVIEQLRKLRPDVAIVALGASANLASLLRILEAGADGVCLKLDSTNEIETILKRCVRGRHDSQRPEAAWSQGASAAARRRAEPGRNVSLTPKERRVLELLIQGLSTGKIAAELGVGEATVRTHLQHLFNKFDVHSRLALVAHAVRTEAVNIGGDRRSLPKAS